MERRQFIRALCSGVVAWPLAAYAQQVSNPRRIGVLGADASVWRPWTSAFAARLRELGWLEGETIAIDYRWAEGSSQRVSEVAAEFLRQNVDVIVSYGSAVATLKQATTTIPIVFAVAFDPVRGENHGWAIAGNSDPRGSGRPSRPEKPATMVVVVGDSMADWLGYGLDENYADHPEIGDCPRPNHLTDGRPSRPTGYRPNKIEPRPVRTLQHTL